MNGTYQQLRDKAISQDFIERLIIALVDVAIEVYNEPADKIGRASCRERV